MKVITPGGACSLRLGVRTPPFHGGNRGSIPLESRKFRVRSSMVEQRPFKPLVSGSSPDALSFFVGE